MPFCPKCRCEYREGFSECADCDEMLIDSFPKTELPKENDHEMYLKTVSTDIDAEMLIEMLAHEGIPVRKKYRECGDYLTVFMGKTVMGIDLFVPSRLYQKASEISNFEAPAISDEELCNIAETTPYETISTFNTTTSTFIEACISTPSETDISTSNEAATSTPSEDATSISNETTTNTPNSTIANVTDYSTYNAAEIPKIDTNKYVDSYIKRQRTVQLVLLIVFISPIIIALLVSLFFLIKHLLMS